jgi:hypothetical protein
MIILLSENDIETRQSDFKFPSSYPKIPKEMFTLADLVIFTDSNGITHTVKNRLDM